MDVPVRIQTGESLPFSFDRDGESITNWICTIYVKKLQTDAATIERIISADSSGLSWTGFLTSTETAALATGLWYLTAVLVNATTIEQEEIPKKFTVTPTWKS